MAVLVMAAFGALFATGLLATVFTVQGIELLAGLGPALHRLRARTERLTLWMLGALVLALLVWARTGWPVATMWTFAGVISIPLMRPTGTKVGDEIAKVEAIATWAEQVRDTMSASAGLQQALVASSANAPEPLAAALGAFARRAPRGSLAGALRALGRDLDHPSADLVIAGLLSAVELDAGRLVPLLSRLAASIRGEAQMRVRIEVGRARIRTSMVLVGFFVALTALMLLLVADDLLVGYDSTAGQLWLLLVGAIVVIAIWSSRKLAEIPLPERFVYRVPAS